MLTQEQLLKRLDKKLQLMGLDENHIAWLPDKEDDKTYTWAFLYKGRHIQITINKRTKITTAEYY